MRIAHRFKHIVISILVVFYFFSCSPIIEKILFENNDALPHKIIFDEKYFEKTGNIFFIMQDSQSNYSNLVEYDISRGVIVKEIFSLIKAEGKILEVSNNSRYIVFSVLLREEKAIQKSFYYDITEQQLFEPIVTMFREYDLIFPLHIDIDGNKIGWLNQDFKNQCSSIHIYDIESKISNILITEPFLDNSMKVSIFFLELADGKLFFDVKSTNEYNLTVYDYLINKTLAIFPVLPEIHLNFNAKYNNLENYLVLYAKGMESDLTYLLNLSDGRVQKLAGFYPNSVIYNDRIEISGDKVIYPVQKNVLGNINEYHYVESYNIKTFKMERINLCFDVVSSKNYIGYLKFKTDTNHKDIYFELLKK